MEEFGRLSEATPAPEECAALRGHENARRHLRQGEASKVAFAYAEDQPMIPATIVAAELEVSRNFDPLFLGAFYPQGFGRDKRPGFRPWVGWGASRFDKLPRIGGCL